MYLPIGSIIAWHKSLANTPALPAGWVECNGGVLDNPTSPYHGQEIPDLNGAARFLRGGASSGVLQDDALQGHFHEVHNGTYGLKYGTFGAAASGAMCAETSGPGAYKARQMVNDGSHGTPRAAAETRPLNMSVVWIMKVSNAKHESRLLNVEDEDVHVNIGPNATVNGTVGATKTGVTTGSGQGGMTEGAPFGGKMPITCVRIGAVDTSGVPRSIDLDDCFEIVLSYALMTKRLGKPFVFAGCTFSLWNPTTGAWYVPDASKMTVASKLLAGAAASNQLSAVLSIKGASAGEYVVIGADQP